LMISDFRRDIFPLVKWFLWLVAKPKEMRPGLFSSINAAYTLAEIRSMLPEMMHSSCDVVGGPMGLKIVGVKDLPPSRCQRPYAIATSAPRGLAKSQ